MNGSDQDEFLKNRKSPWWLLRFATKRPPPSYFAIKIAWPVYAWRVVAPQPFDRGTNPLQRAVLRLARARVTQKTEIARLIGVEDLLIKHIQESNFNQGFLDRNGQLIANGKAMLEKKEPPDLSQSVLESGWVFRDALGGDVLPIFYQGSLPPAPLRAVKEVVSLPYSSVFRDKPSVQGILTSLRRYGRMARIEQTEEFGSDLLTDPVDSDELWTEWDEVDESEAAPQTTSGAPPKLVSIINLTPEQVDLETYFYIPPDDPTTWMIQSPFNLSGKWWYKQRLEWVMERSPELRKMIEGWSKEARQEFTRKYPSIDYAGESERDKIIAVFPTLGSNPLLHHTLTELTQAYRGELLFREDPNNLDLVLVRYTKVMEALLNACLDTIPEKHELARKIFGKGNLDEKAKSLAQELPFENPYPWYLSKSDAENVADDRPKNLPHRVLFLIGHAYHERTSPLRTALKREPQLLRLIKDIADYRNTRGAHHDRENSANKESIVIFQEVNKAAHIVITVLLTNFFKEN